MGEYTQILIFVIAGIVLLWFGYSLFFGKSSPFYLGLFSRKKFNGNEDKGRPGDPQVCPICSMKLIKGDLVKTLAFPSATGSADRKMYIRGCYNCLEGNLQRSCPICGIDLETSDYLISRMFERREKKNHIHVLGCNHCKKTGNLPK